MPKTSMKVNDKWIKIIVLEYRFVLGRGNRLLFLQMDRWWAKVLIYREEYCSCSSKLVSGDMVRGAPSPLHRPMGALRGHVGGGGVARGSQG